MSEDENTKLIILTLGRTEIKDVWEQSAEENIST
jgi:hypothetical protein